MHELELFWKIFSLLLDAKKLGHILEMSTGPVTGSCKNVRGIKDQINKRIKEI